MKVEKRKENHVGHNNGGAGRVAPPPIPLDDESKKSCNSNNIELG